MENYYGRLLTAKEIEQNSDLSLFEQIPAMISDGKSKVVCQRCGTSHLKSEVQLPIGAYYCPTCISLGRIRSDQELYQLHQQDFTGQSYLEWTGDLTPAQQELSDALFKSVQQHEKVLVHAVTGAGKTEMIYASIEAVLANGGSVCLASPRVDVCIELHQRFSRDFRCPIPLLHGEGEPYFRSPLVICTSHQLLRFRSAFDLLIIDEVDAFPFVDNEMLYYAVEKAQKATCSLVYLTATSTDHLDREVREGTLKKLQLSRRFHGNPLSLPKNIWHRHFLSDFKKQRKTGFPLLIFAPEIDYGQELSEKLKVDFVSSRTKNRQEIVENFRQQKISVLVTTTILERGVTFPELDVFVLRAEHRNFSKSALIQIAGRVGRSSSRPTGLVHFYHEGISPAMAAAIREIKQLNRAGGF